MSADPSFSQILGRFRNAWNDPTPPRIEDYLPPPGAPQYLSLLIDLVRIDVERRLAAGERVRVEETYLRDFPALSADPQAVVALVLHEFELRRAREPDLSPSEYLRRFPQYGNELLLGLPTDRWLTRKSEGTPLETPPLPANEMGVGPGSRLGSYDLLDRLGGGGMGVVFRARHRVLKKEFALKILSPRLACDPEALQRFRRETEAAGRLEHANLVRASDAGVEGSIPFLVMELLDGCDLSRLVQRRGPLPVAEACEAVRHAALGLQHAHECGLVHRDVKPSNLQWTEAGVVKVLDLGLARLCAAGDADPLTGTGHGGMGTPDYIAPEQVLDGRAAGVGSDLYSLGCTLFHLLAGEPPFGPSTHLTVARKHEAHVKEPAPDVRSRRPDVPPGLAALVAQLLAKRPEDRPASAREVAEALAPYAAGTRPDQPAGADPDQRLPGETPPAHRRHRRWVVPVSVVVLLGLAGGWLGTRHPAPPTSAGQPGLAVRVLRAWRFGDAGDNDLDLGELGREPNWRAVKDDKVQIEVELSEPAFAYLLALDPADDPTKRVHLCPRADEGVAPVARVRWTYPAGTVKYRLDDGAGLQAFALVASRQPLPAWVEWRRRAPDLAWDKVPATSGFVWRDDGMGLRVGRAQGDVRGTEVASKEDAQLRELGRRLRSAPGVEAVALLGFAVDP
jgi:serine/threonine protein kinase